MDNDELLKGKFSNIFIKLIVGIMSNDLKDIKHYLSDDLYNQLQSMIDQNISNNEIRCFDEPNVKEILIENVEHDQEYEIVYVTLVSRYMDYYIDSNTLEYKRGVNDHRIELNHKLIFKKNNNVSIMNNAIKCPSCGANLDSNNSGYCNYCGVINSAESYDYVLYGVTNL